MEISDNITGLYKHLSERKRKEKEFLSGLNLWPPHVISFEIR